MKVFARYVLFVFATLNLVGGVLGAIFMQPSGLVAAIAWVAAGIGGWAFMFVVACIAEDADAIREHLGADTPSSRRQPAGLDERLAERFAKQQRSE